MTRPRATRPVLASALFVVTCLFSMGQVSEGQTATSAPQRESDPTDIWKYALTQGGLTLVVLALGWSYKRDMERWAEERLKFQADVTRERDAYQQTRIDEALRTNRTLERLIDQADVTLKAVTESMTRVAVVLTENNGSVHRVARAAENLEARLRGGERGEK